MNRIAPGVVFSVRTVPLWVPDSCGFFAVTSGATITKNQAKGRPDRQKLDDVRAERAAPVEGEKRRGSLRIAFGLETADDRPLVGV